MSEVVTVRCPSCGKGYRIGADKLGRRTRCTGCRSAFTLAAESEASLDLMESLGKPVPGSVEPVPEPSPQYLPPRPAARSASVGSAWAQKSFLQKAGAIVVLIVFVAVMGGLKWRSMQRRNEAATRLGERIAAPDERTSQPVHPPVVRPQPAPSAPSPTKPITKLTFSSEAGLQVGRGIASGQAKRTEVRLYLPPGASAQSPVPCVFVAPAGSNLLVGVPFGDGEHEDFLPLLQHGMAVCFYTLDGTTADFESLSDMQMVVLIQQYIQADGGVHNLRDAIDSVLASAPGVDPGRLAVCGHSSAATIALTAIGKEPRIKAAAVMAPAIDLPTRFGEEIMNTSGAAMINFIRTHSPSTIEPTGKVFLFQAQDDTNTPVAEAQAYAARHPDKVTLKLIPQGGHGGAYHEGLEPCFRYLAQTLRAQAVNVVVRPTLDDKSVAAAPRAAETPRTSEPPKSGVTGQTDEPRVRATPALAPAARPPADPNAPKTTDPVPPILASAVKSERLTYSSMATPIENAPLPTDKPFGGLSMASRDYMIRIQDPPRSFVNRPGGVARIGGQGYAPRLRYRLLHAARCQFVVSARAADDPDGLLQITESGLKIIVHIPSEQAKEVPFLTPNGRGSSIEMNDFDGGIATAEYLVAGVMGDYVGVFHAIVARDDAEGMRDVKALIDSFKAN